ncbi:hypothetical protein J6590_033234 [Homalodisca vitripennis]|nr:hypothetical protein J6590_033234 [Homalodisca vitripennis]
MASARNPIILSRTCTEGFQAKWVNNLGPESIFHSKNSHGITNSWFLGAVLLRVQKVLEIGIFLIIGASKCLEKSATYRSRSLCYVLEAGIFRGNNLPIVGSLLKLGICRLQASRELHGLQEMAQQGSHLPSGTSLPRNPSTLTLPPAYDLLMGASGGNVGPSEPPPPSYEEAMFLIGDEKSRALLENRHNTSIDNRSKETV